VQRLGDDVDQGRPVRGERRGERGFEISGVLHPPAPDAIGLRDPGVLAGREVDREVAAVKPLRWPALIQPKVALAITTMVIGRARRTIVSSSPDAKPKLPSPMTAMHLASGRPTWAPTEAGSA